MFLISLKDHLKPTARLNPPINLSELKPTETVQTLHRIDLWIHANDRRKNQIVFSGTKTILPHPKVTFEKGKSKDKSDFGWDSQVNSGFWFLNFLVWTYLVLGDIQIVQKSYWRIVLKEGHC
jgi:hypothetical protein